MIFIVFQTITSKKKLFVKWFCFFSCCIKCADFCVCVYTLCYVQCFCVHMADCACHCCVCISPLFNGQLLVYRLWKASLFRVSCTSGSTLFSATSSAARRPCAPSMSFPTWPTRASSTSTASPPTHCCVRYWNTVTSLLHWHSVHPASSAFNHLQ